MFSLRTSVFIELNMGLILAYWRELLRVSEGFPGPEVGQAFQDSARHNVPRVSSITQQHSMCSSATDDEKLCVQRCLGRVQKLWSVTSDRNQSE